MRFLPLLLGGLALLALAGCGCDDCDDGYYVPPGPYLGEVYVDNLTDTTIPEAVFGFYLAPAGTVGFTGNLLTAPLGPAQIQYVGDYAEGYWDAEADMEFGDLVTWFDVFVPAFDSTYFEVY